MEQFDEEHLVRDLNVTHSKEKPQSPAVYLATPTGVELVLMLNQHAETVSKWRF